MATTKRTATKSAEKSVVSLKPIEVKTAMFTIEGLSPLIQHKWSEKALRMIREKKAGKKTKTREVCDPAVEAQDATYFTASGQYGVPVGALMKCIIGAAHKDIGVEKTLVRKSVFIKCDDPNKVLVMDCDEPKVREDYVRVGGQSADLRYRPEFTDWAVTFEVTYEANSITLTDLANLIERAGFSIGLCEWRPEKGGEFGRFQLRRD